MKCGGSGQSNSQKSQGDKMVNLHAFNIYLSSVHTRDLKHEKTTSSKKKVKYEKKQSIDENVIYPKLYKLYL